MDADSIQSDRSEQSDTCVLRRSLTAPAVARGFVSSALADWADDGADGAFEDLPLLASELVSNAVIHGSGAVGVSIRGDGRHVRLAVSDSSEVPPVKQDLESARNGGLGLHIVERLASHWGLERHAGGKTVWCEVVVGPR